ncbi:MAG: hypothetical protein K2M07_04265 [Muribaculaceae bacterium]|nr:hypothetical protein [Muribaculaceae bacterium]
MKFSNLILSTLAASALLIPADALAKKGAPHTFSVTPNFSTLNVKWADPTTDKELKWHNDYDYDGDAGEQASSQAPAVIFVAAEFTPADLALVKGEKIESLNYFEYRPVVGVTAIIWEDGKIVRQQEGNMADPAYKANQWRTIKFDQPYEISGDKTIRIGFKISHGSNMNFVAIMNNIANSKGDLRSYDGKSWVHNGRGTYLITANLANDVDEAPSYYNVYVDGVKVNKMPVKTTSTSISKQTDGSHKVKVEAVYTNNESFSSPEADVTVKGADSYFPPVAGASALTDGVNGIVEWESPLLRSGNELTWSSKVQGIKVDNEGNTSVWSIGGTASSNTKLWIKNEFTANDLLQFKGAKIKAINAHFTEAAVLGMTLFVMKDGEFVSYEAVPEDVIATVKAGEWTKFTLTEPVEIEEGSSYTYGYYLLQTPKTHPVSVDNTIPMTGKGNSFSTSSPNSTDFTKSKPSWKTLASGSIPGQWMMTADIEGGEIPGTTVASYNIYRNGDKIAEGVKTAAFEDEVPAPGVYTYGIEAVGSDAKTSDLYAVKANYKLPDSYRAPLIVSTDFNKEEQTFELKWGMDLEMKHYQTATYKVGFDEDMALSYGTKFAAQELMDYEGYTINALSFVVGCDIENGFTLQITNGAGKTLWSQEIPAGVVQPLAFYTFPLEEPVTITGQEDLYFSYSATLKGGTSPIVLDGGPLAEGGAMVKFAGTSSWMKLGTLNPTYNGYNIVIGALVSEPAETEAETQMKMIGSDYLSTLPLISSKEAIKGFGIEGTATLRSRAPRALKPAQFNVYRNGEMIGSTSNKNYVDNLPDYDTFTYTVSAVYPNGWESAKSDAVVIENNIRQAAPAPYDLTSDGKTLSWKAPETAPVLTYAADGASYGVGMTGSGTLTSYIVNKFEPEALKDYVGKVISHIKFALYTNEINTASVVVIKDFNIIYEQPVNVDDIVAISTGYNDIRLNKPVAIEPDATYMIGYVLTYPNGIKPMLFDAGPAVDGYGNLLSSTASHTSWKSLKSMNKSLDGNWRIYATLASPAGKHTLKAEGLTYNIYLDGKPFKTGITTESYTHSETLPEGEYTVTAGEGENETAPSNPFRVESSGVEGIAADNNGEAAEYFNLQGVKVDAANIVPGVYIRHSATKDEKVVVK